MILQHSSYSITLKAHAPMLRLIRYIFYRKCPPLTHFCKKGKNFHHCQQNTRQFILLTGESNTETIAKSVSICFQNMPIAFTNRHFDCFWTVLNTHMHTLLFIFFQFRRIILALVQKLNFWLILGVKNLWNSRVM